MALIAERALLNKLHVLQTQITNWPSATNPSQQDLFTTLKELIRLGIVESTNLPSKNTNQEIIPLATSIKFIHLVALEELQLEDPLKQEIAKACRIFAELTLLRLIMQNRTVYPSTLQESIAKLQNVLTTLPKQEVATRYHLTCSLAAVKLWESPSQWLTAFAKKHWKNLANLVAKFDITSSFAIFEDLLQQLYFDIKMNWYAEGSALNRRAIWIAQEKLPLQNLVENHKWKKSEDLTLSLVEALGFIILHASSKQLQQDALQGTDHTKGLLHFTEWKRERNKQWSIRYLALDYLHIIFSQTPLAQEKEPSLAYSTLLVQAINKEKNKQVNHLLQINLPKYQEYLQQQIAQIKDIALEESDIELQQAQIELQNSEQKMEKQQQEKPEKSYLQAYGSEDEEEKLASWEKEMQQIDKELHEKLDLVEGLELRKQNILFLKALQNNNDY